MRILRHLSATLALCVLGSPIGLAQSVQVEKYKLPNGMTVILHEDRTVPIVTINTWFRVGSKDEPPRRSGFAHLFEHLMFMGTKRVPNGQFDRLMENDGGYNNASTAEDRTNYFSVGPSNLLPMLLWLDAERFESLGENIDLAKLDLQRDVVKNERRQTTENVPYGKAYEALNGLMFPANHPYGTSVIGSMEDLTAASVDDVKSFFKTFYTPNNASLVVAGDFRIGEIKPLINRLFGTLKRGNDPVRKPVPAIDFKGVRRITMVDQVESAKTIMVWHSPAAYKPGDAEMSIASSVLSDGVSSRLVDRLVVKERLATEISAFQESRQLGSLFTIDATLAPGVSQDRLEAGIDQVLREFIANGPTAEEVARQTAKIETGYVNGLQSLSQKADKLNEYEFYLGEPNSFSKVMDSYRNTTPAAIKESVGKTLSLWSRLILRVVPMTETPAVNPRDAVPVVPPPSTFAAKLPVEFTLVGGVKVYYWRRQDLPLMQLQVLFPGGTESDGAKPGLTDLMAEMATQGAGDLDASQFESAVSALGASVNVTAGSRFTTASLSSLAGNFSLAIPYLSDALRRPKHSIQDSTRVQQVRVARLDEQATDASSIARKVADREFFGATHPLGQPADGTTASVNALTLTDVVQRHSAIFQPQRAVVYAAGSLPGPDLKRELDRLFAGWYAGTAPLITPAVPEVPVKPLRVILVHRPEAVQTVIRFVQPGVPYDSSSRLPFEAIGTILGGTFTSRLNQNLREAKGYTYGAGSTFSFEPTLGTFAASSSVRADVTGASIKEFLLEINGIRKGDITPVETAKAVASLRTQVINRLATFGGLLGTATEYGSFGRLFAGVNEDLAALNSITPGLLNGMVKDALPIESGVLVLVGDRAKILPQLEGLGLPKPEEVTFKP